MKFCQYCGKEIMDEAVMCVHCGCAVTSQKNASNDAPSTGMAVLGFFIPLVGLICYLAMKAQTPLKAKSAGKGALIGFIVSIVLTIIYVIIVATAVSSYTRYLY